MKQEILDRLNEIIVEEKGVRVNMGSLFIDSELDSLGTVITIATLEGDYPELFSDIPIGQDALSTIDFQTLTVRELVRKCISSKKSTSPEASSKTSK
jgi:acyl carrier protein